MIIINWLVKRKTLNDFTVYLRNNKITEKFNCLTKYKKMLYFLNAHRSYLLCGDVTHLTDAANDFNEKTNNNLNKIIAQYSYLFILFIQFIC